MKPENITRQHAGTSDVVKIMFLLMMLLTSKLLFAQGRLSVEFRPSANSPTSDFGNVKVERGGGFEAVGAFRFMPHLSAYFGWGKNTFKVADSFTGPDSRFEETGYTYGLQFIHPLKKESKVSLMIRGGGVANHIEVENGDGNIVADSGHGFGWQAEGGLSIPVSRSWCLRPGLRYHSLSRSISLGSSETKGTLNYLSLGLGVCWQF